jgi:HSP20 family protein
MLVRTDPFRELDRVAQQVLGTRGRPAVMPMDAWREQDRVIIEFDLPGIPSDAVDLDVERNVLTVTAHRAPLGNAVETLTAERSRGVFSRQLVLGDNVDLDRIQATTSEGVLRLVIPVAERAKPRKIAVQSAGGDSQISSGSPQQVTERKQERETVDA